MNSLYEIEQNLLTIFSQIEELDGELTPELDTQLEIAESDYKQKIENYAKVVTQFEADIKAIKDEQDRLNRRKKVLENRVARLKGIMLNAVNDFGPVETPTFKIGTRKSKSIELDEVRINKLSTSVMKFAKEMRDNSVIMYGDDFDLDGMLAVINANCKAEFEHDYPEEEFIPYTVNDLACVKINVNNDSTLESLFTTKGGILHAMLANEAYFTITDATKKTDVKNFVAAIGNTTISNTVENVSLSIR